LTAASPGRWASKRIRDESWDHAGGSDPIPLGVRMSRDPFPSHIIVRNRMMPDTSQKRSAAGEKERVLQRVIFNSIKLTAMSLS
jgi:hypothetical protein